MLTGSIRPVIIIGHGCTGAKHLLPALMELGIPIVTSWQAKDLVDNYADNYMGSSGIYGNRPANKALYAADLVIAIGCRLSIWQVGYGVFAPGARLIICDIDSGELDRFPQADRHCADAAEFISALLEGNHVGGRPSAWLDQCRKWKQQYPILESAHNDKAGYIHSNRFVNALNGYIRPEELIVTDMGSAMVAAHQVLKLKPPQRLMTSGGLGEMGVALPAAIGASFATNKGQVLCLHCDGGMMMNLQELATIAHHKLPIKIIVFNNSGYTMIRKSQDIQMQGRYSGSSTNDLSFPDFVKLSRSFGIEAWRIDSWDSFDSIMPSFMSYDGPLLIDYVMDPDQALLPKLLPIVNVDGSISDAQFDQMSPILP